MAEMLTLDLQDNDWEQASDGHENVLISTVSNDDFYVYLGPTKPTDPIEETPYVPGRKWAPVSFTGLIASDKVWIRASSYNHMVTVVRG